MILYFKYLQEHSSMSKWKQVSTNANEIKICEIDDCINIHPLEVTF